MNRLNQRTQQIIGISNSTIKVTSSNAAGEYCACRIRSFTDGMLIGETQATYKRPHERSLPVRLKQLADE